MRDHRDDAAEPFPVLSDITEAVHRHVARHPGSVKRTPKADRRAAGKRAKLQRRKNR